MKIALSTAIVCSSLILLSNCGASEEKQQPEKNYSISELLKLQDPTDIITELDTKIDERSHFGEDMSTLSEGEKVIMFVEDLEGEVNNGGFDQFFFNSSGNYSKETLEALKKIGAFEKVRIVERAYSKWPNGTIPADRTKRQNLLEKVRTGAEKTWRECDEQFCTSKEDISTLLVMFVKKNLNEFK